MSTYSIAVVDLDRIAIVLVVSVISASDLSGMSCRPFCINTCRYHCLAGKNGELASGYVVGTHGEMEAGNVCRRLIGGKNSFNCTI